MGEGRYQTLLCLVQVAVPDPEAEDGLRVALLDPLQGSWDPSPLAAVLADPSIEVVLHAARQDVALLRREWDTEVRGLFDTQVAAGFAGLPAQAGYDRLLSELVGVKLRKGASYTRWDRRPLSAEQRRYAAEDVLHLLELADALKERLEQRGRLAWAIEEGRPLEESSDERSPAQAFAKLPKIASLDPRSRATAMALCEWRDELARAQDRPPAQVLQDAPLVEIARRRPASVEELERIRGLNPSSLRRRGGDVLEVVAAARDREPLAREGERRPQPSAEDAPLVALAEALVRQRSAQESLAYELLATRADLQAVVTAARLGAQDPDVRTLRGWRRGVVGDDLHALLAGRRTLSVRDSKLVVTEA